MKVKGWFIEGFGIFRDFEVRSLGPGLTVFSGPNEAGKSTLLAFVRGMLFGFPDSRGRENRYLPLRGGRHGGRMVVSGPDADYIIERQVGGRPPFRITGTNGRLATDATMARLVGGADDRLFRSVFAFSLTELQSFDSLSADGVRDRIFSAGIAGAGRSARDAVQELEARGAGLLKNRGQGTINTLLADIAALGTRIDQARADAATYADLVAEEERCRLEIDRIGRDADQLQARLSRAAAFVDLWPTWHELRTARAELATLDPVDTFPQGAEARLAAILQQAQIADESLIELSAAQRLAQERRAELRIDDAVWSVAEEVEHLHEMVALQRNLLQQLPAARLRVFQTRELLDERLRSLGPDWDEERVEEFDQSIPRQEEVRAWQERLQRAAADVDRFGREVEASQRHRDELQQARDRLAGSIGENQPAARSLDEQVKLVRRLRANLSDLKGEESAAAAQDSIVKDRERALRLLDSSLRQPVAAGVIAGVAGLPLAAVGLAVWRGLAGDSTGTMAGAGLAVLGLLAVAALVAVRARQTARLADADRTRTVLSAELDDAVAGRVRHRHKAAVLLELVSEDATALGLSTRPSFQEIEDKDGDLARQRTEHAQWGDAHARLAEADLKLRDATAEADRLSRARDEARHASEALQAEWADWKHQAQLPASLSPQGVLDYFEAIRVCREGIQARKAAKSAGVQLTEQIGGWEDRARAVLSALGVREMLAEEQLIDRIVEVRRRCAEDRHSRALAETLDEEICQRAVKLAQIEATLRRSAEERARLLADTGAQDEAAFKRRFEVFQRRALLHAKVADLESSIVTRIGQGPEADTIRAELASGRVEEWRAVVASAETRGAELRHERDEAVARHRDAQRARIELESSADVARLELEHAALVAELVEAVRQWQITRLAGSLIEETLRDFERTRQPEVLAEASRTFAFITHGRYERLVQEENAEDIVVVDTRGGRRPVEALSRGTAEQLYLCIRLALAAEFARRSEPLPLVMDDVFVNFDPDRAEAVANVVADFATRHQVLLFTCHPSTRDLLTRVDPGAAVVELRPGEPVAAVLPKPARARPVEVIAPPTAEPMPELDSGEAPLLDLLEETRAGEATGDAPGVDRGEPAVAAEPPTPQPQPT
jgi:uncharacterized protein YhaN